MVGFVGFWLGGGSLVGFQNRCVGRVELSNGTRVYEGLIHYFWAFLGFLDYFTTHYFWETMRLFTINSVDLRNADLVLVFVSLY